MNIELNLDPPVITIDGTAGSGKGTISYKLSKELGWHFLDSGLLYRGLALSCILYINRSNNFNDNLDILKLAEQISINNLDIVNLEESILINLANELELQVDDEKIYVKNLSSELQNVSIAIRSELCANFASKLAALPMIRKILLGKQRALLRYPGLVADGRDMGTVVFPQARLKFFLDADPKIRALRRHIQLNGPSIDGNLANYIDKISERDVRDSKRIAAPLKPAKDAIYVDTTTMSIDEVYSIIFKHVKLIILR